MGIDLIWQDERGAEIERINDDPHNYLSLLVLAITLNEFICLRFLDPYGHTYFNQKQIPVLLDELIKVRATITDGQFQSYSANRASRGEERRLARHFSTAVGKFLETPEG